MPAKAAATAEVPSDATTVPVAVPSRSYIWDKLHSLSGIVPIGAFLAEHFWSNSYALVSIDRYNQASYDLQTIPWRVTAFPLWLWKRVRTGSAIAVSLFRLFLPVLALNTRRFRREV